MAYSRSTFKTFENARFVHRYDKYILIKSYEEPGGFGSANKIVYLYTKQYIRIGKARFGEHPLELVSWDNDTIVLKIASDRAFSESRRDYIIRWVGKNPKIGPFDLKYIIIGGDERIEL